MFAHVYAALRRIQNDIAQLLEPAAIHAVCHEVGHRFRRRQLDPVTTIHLFLLQILHGNFAIARLKDFTDRVFSEAAYCKARMRLPLAVLQTLLRRVGTACSRRWTSTAAGTAIAPSTPTAPPSACPTHPNCRNISANRAARSPVAAFPSPTS